MTVHSRERTRSPQVGNVIILVLEALLALGVLWLLWIGLPHSPTGVIGILHRTIL
jgi:hypothetical protein